MLYIVYFMLPRFFNLSLVDKLETIVHEMYHMSPQFDGDLRVMEGRSPLHGKSLKHYDSIISDLTQQFLDSAPPARTYDFLRCSYRNTELKFGKVIANHIPEPKPKLLHVATGRRILV